MTGGSRKLQNEELHNFCSSSNRVTIIKPMRVRGPGYVARMGEKGNAYRILVRKSEGKRPLEIPRYSWDEDIKIDLRVTGWGGVDWILLAQNRDHWGFFMTAVKNLQVS
jgi:hypothetical protein